MSTLAKLLRTRQKDGAPAVPQPAAKRRKSSHNQSYGSKSQRKSSAHKPVPPQPVPEPPSSDGEEEEPLQPLIGDSRSAYDALMNMFSSGKGQAAAAMRRRQREQAGDSSDEEDQEVRARLPAATLPPPCICRRAHGQSHARALSCWPRTAA